VEEVEAVRVAAAAVAPPVARQVEDEVVAAPTVPVPVPAPAAVDPVAAEAQVLVALPWARALRIPAAAPQEAAA